MVDDSGRDRPRPAAPRAGGDPRSPRPPFQESADRARLARAAFALAATSLVLHLALAGLVELSPQEAYYWQYARHLDLSYFDHPPLAAWTIRLTTDLLGASERGVRAAAVVHAGLFSLFFFLAGRRLFGSRAAFLALAAACATPLFALGQTVITPDAPLLAGWAAALYFTARALDEERGAWLLAAGAAVGFAALGKYTGWLLAPQILLALLLDARGRRLLRTAWPYLGVALAAALFAPVVIWNARHAWVSFGFQLGDRAAAARSFSLARIGRFVGLQALLLTPVLLGALCVAAVAAARRGRQASYRLCAIFALPGLALFLAVSPFVWVKGNWPAPVWPSAYLAAAGLWAERPRRLTGLATVALLTAAAGALYGHLALLVPALPFSAKDDVTRGWRALAARVDEERARLPADAFVAGCSYKPASELAFYLPDRPPTWAQNVVGEPALAYDLWGDPAALRGRQGLLVLDPRDGSCRERARFCDPLAELAPLRVTRAGREVVTFRLWRCGYQGAAR